MLKIPSFILGGLLILTGLIGYLAQDSSLSIKISGPLASDAEFVLKDGEQTRAPMLKSQVSAGLAALSEPAAGFSVTLMAG